MGKLYRDRDEIPIPPEAYVNTSDGRVYVKQADERGRERRVVIGKAATASTMAPNESFRALFPAAWEAAYGRDELIRLEVGVGAYALLLAAGTKGGAYPVAQAAYGLDTGNALMDYAMFSILGRSDATHLIEDALADEVTFCPTVRSDSWYSGAFRSLTEDQHLAFRAGSSAAGSSASTTSGSASTGRTTTARRGTATCPSSGRTRATTGQRRWSPTSRP